MWLRATLYYYTCVHGCGETDNCLSYPVVCCFPQSLFLGTHYYYLFIFFQFKKKYKKKALCGHMAI